MTNLKLLKDLASLFRVRPTKINHLNLQYLQFFINTNKHALFRHFLRPIEIMAYFPKI